MASAPSPATIEQTVLAAIRNDEQQIHAYLPTLPTGRSVEEIGNWILALDPWFFRLIQFNAPTQWLTAQGLPNAAQYLDAMRRDLANARQVYVDMYKNVVAAQSAWPGMWAEANTTALNNMTAAIQYRDAVFERWVRNYFDVAESRCFDCHTAIGICGGGYCLKCARRRGWIA